MSKEEWGKKSVRDRADRCSDENTVGPRADAMEALSLMSTTGSGRLLVTEGNRLIGVLSLKDLLRFFSLKVELGEA